MVEVGLRLILPFFPPGCSVVPPPFFLVYNITLVSVYNIVIQYFYRLYSIKSFYRIMTTIPCAIQCILVAYLFYV